MSRSAVAVPVTVPMRYMRDMVEVAQAAGIPCERILAWACGLDADLLQAKKARVSLSQFSRLFGALVLHTGDEGAGLSSIRVASGGVETMCRVGITTATLEEATAVLSRALNAIAGGMAVHCCAEASEFRIVFTEIKPVVDRRQSTFEVLLLTVYAILSWLVGRRPPLLSADFPGAAPRHLFELRTLFAGPLRFNQPHAALRIDASQAKLPVVRTTGELTKLLRRAPASLIETLIHRGGLTLAVRQQLHAALPEQLPIEALAKRLSMSARTLHRRLVAEGTTFQKVKDDVRRDVAIYALTRTNQPLKQIAEIVGFQDQSSFQRAFLRWTGRSPRTTRGSAPRPAR